MKSASHLVHADARASARTRRTRDAAPSDYGSPAEARALLANSLAGRQQRLRADDLISTDEAAALAGTSRVTVNAWIAKGRAIGLTQVKRGHRLPRWQFEPRLWDTLPQLSAALGTKEGWALLAFLESPHGGIGGITPRQAIEQGQAARVIQIAEREGN
ncbi:hypothetical protein [Piscinibacter sp.]|uniref:hypothetical protein n=1 Tax=Piscinibacter sp. TaxID=1903157 RepID=UPI0039E29BFE